MSDVVENTEITPEDQKYIDRARGETTEESVVDQHYKEDGTPVEQFKMPEKFEGKSAEEIAKAYVELEKLKEKQANTEPTEGQNSTKDVEETNESNEETKEQNEASDAVNELLTPKDFQKYEQSFAENGSLTEADYKELADKGLSKEVVDNYIEAQRLKTEVYTNKLYEATGGEEGWNEMIAWARENLTQEQAKRVDTAITSGNLEDAMYEVESIKLRMGTPPRRVDGQGAGNGGFKGYNNMTEYYADMRNPAYKKDVKFRDMVDKKFLAFKGML